MSKKNLMYLATGIAFLVFALCIAYIFTEPSSSSSPVAQEGILQEQDASLLQTSSAPQTPPPADSLVFSAQNNETQITTPPPAQDIPRIDPINPIEEIKPAAENTFAVSDDFTQNIPAAPEQEQKPAPIFQENEPVTEKLIPLDNEPIKIPSAASGSKPKYDPVKEAQNSITENKETDIQKPASLPEEKDTADSDENSGGQTAQNSEPAKEPVQETEKTEDKKQPLQDKLPVPFVEDSLKTRVILAPDKKINTIVYAELMMDGNQVGLVFEGNKPIKPKTFRLQNPDRVVVDIEGFWKLKLPQLISNRMVKDVRFNAQKDKTRIVFDLKIPATSTLLYRIHSRKYQLVFK